MDGEARAWAMAAKRFVVVFATASPMLLAEIRQETVVKSLFSTISPARTGR
jgi:hypothetical protein